MKDYRPIKIENILVLISPANPYKEELKRLFPNSGIVFSAGNLVTEEDILKADIIIGNPPAESLKKSKKIRFLQLQSAGADAYTQGKILPKEALLACAAGAYGQAVSEHMLASLLAVYRNLHLYRDHQRECKWMPEGKVRSLRGENVLVLGLGDIGSEFARLVKALGASVSGVKRNLAQKPDFVDAAYPLEKLPELLPQFDVVASVLPSSPETYRLFDEATFSRMKPGAVFINAGRGTSTDLQALQKALQEGPLFAACLDVTDPEPLPKEHPLWLCPNVLITPHAAGGFSLEETFHRVWRIALENLSAYKKGAPLKNIIPHK